MESDLSGAVAVESLDIAEKGGGGWMVADQYILQKGSCHSLEC